jgi:excisionase family DNA binding protein
MFPCARLEFVPPRFMTLADVAELLNISASQAYALVRRGDIRAIKVGGRGQWRVEHDEVERYIAACYDEAARLISDDAADERRPVGEATGSLD